MISSLVRCGESCDTNKHGLFVKYTSQRVLWLTMIAPESKTKWQPEPRTWRPNWHIPPSPLQPSSVCRQLVTSDRTQHIWLAPMRDWHVDEVTSSCCEQLHRYSTDTEMYHLQLPAAFYKTAGDTTTNKNTTPLADGRGQEGPRPWETLYTWMHLSRERWRHTVMWERIPQTNSLVVYCKPSLRLFSFELCCLQGKFFGQKTGQK